MKSIILGIFVLAVILTLSGPASAGPEIRGKVVEYRAPGVVMKGYLAYDKSIRGRRPGILVVHEWWGRA